MRNINWLPPVSQAYLVEKKYVLVFLKNKNVLLEGLDSKLVHTEFLLPKCGCRTLSSLATG